jgi:hypothetical protein
MAEPFFIKTEGGPNPGTRIVDETQYPWPLPGILRDVGGNYIKVSQSDLSPQEPGSRVVRSARYRWATDEQIYQWMQEASE